MPRAVYTIDIKNELKLDIISKKKSYKNPASKLLAISRLGLSHLGFSKQRVPHSMYKYWLIISIPLNLFGKGIYNSDQCMTYDNSTCFDAPIGDSTSASIGTPGLVTSHRHPRGTRAAPLLNQHRSVGIA